MHSANAFGPAFARHSEHAPPRQLQVAAGEGEDALPLAYDPDQIAAFWSRRPVAVFTRIVQLLSIAGGFLSGFLFDLATGKLADNEVGHLLCSPPPALCKVLLPPAQMCFLRPYWMQRRSPTATGEAGDRAAQHRDVAGPGVHQAGAGAEHPAGHPVARGDERAAEAVRQGALLRQRRGHARAGVRAGRALAGGECRL